MDNKNENLNKCQCCVNRYVCEGQYEYDCLEDELYRHFSKDNSK